MDTELRERVIGHRILSMLCRRSISRQLEQEMWHAANRKHTQATVSFQEQTSATVQTIPMRDCRGQPCNSLSLGLDNFQIVQGSIATVLLRSCGLWVLPSICIKHRKWHYLCLQSAKLRFDTSISLALTLSLFLFHRRTCPHFSLS